MMTSKPPPKVIYLPQSDSDGCRQKRNLESVGPLHALHVCTLSAPRCPGLPPQRGKSSKPKSKPSPRSDDSLAGLPGSSPFQLFRGAWSATLAAGESRQPRALARDALSPMAAEPRSQASCVALDAPRPGLNIVGVLGLVVPWVCPPASAAAAAVLGQYAHTPGPRASFLRSPGP